MWVNSDKNTIFEFIYFYCKKSTRGMYIISPLNIFLDKRGHCQKESKRLRTTDLDGWQVGIPAGTNLAGLEDHLGPESILLTWLVRHLHG